MNLITENWELLTTLGVGAGWGIDRLMMGKRQDLDVLRGIIEEQKRYTDTLQRRVTDLQNEFEQKCEEMTAKLEGAMHEISVLKKKLSEM